MKKTLQFELWKECNNNCSFCYLGNENKFSHKETKLKNLNKAIDILSDIKTFDEYDTVGFIGGEFFQGQLADKDVKDTFIKLINFVKEQANKNYIKNIWICATLTIGEQKDLYEILDILKDTKAVVWILTSYDTIGRFHTSIMENNWKFHIKNIKDKYPNVMINTTMIITGNLIEKYLNDNISFIKFREDYNTSLFLKLTTHMNGRYKSKEDTNNNIGYFFPKRKDFLYFLKKLRKEDSELYEKIFNIDYRADTLICEYKQKEFISERNKDTILESFDSEIDSVMKCGHLTMYSPYIDCEKCALCDKKIIDKMFE